MLVKFLLIIFMFSEKNVLVMRLQRCLLGTGSRRQAKTSAQLDDGKKVDLLKSNHLMQEKAKKEEEEKVAEAQRRLH